MSQLWARPKITAWSLSDAFADPMSFIPNQAANAETMRNGTQMKPAFCSQSRVVSSTGCDSPPIAPNTPTVMTSGIRNCITADARGCRAPR